ncbi:SET domain protein, partial [Ichthyophthirius multifiliis]
MRVIIINRKYKRCSIFNTYEYSKYIQIQDYNNEKKGRNNKKNIELKLNENNYNIFQNYINVFYQQNGDVFYFQKQILNENLINYLSQTQIFNIDKIRERVFQFINILKNKIKKLKVKNNIYYQYEKFDLDIKKLFNFTLIFRCQSMNSYKYINYLIQQYEQNVQNNNIINKFIEMKKNDLFNLLNIDLCNKLKVKKWPIIPQYYRNYEQIEDFCIQPMSWENKIQEKIRSEKNPSKCDNKCVCENLEKMGKFDLEKSTWKSKCPNRGNRIECKDCNCKNQSISKKEKKIIGQDVEENVSWGIDLYTKKNIFYVINECASDKDKNQFIQFQLLKAVNLLKENGWDIQKVCQFIIDNSQKKCQIGQDYRNYLFSNQDKKFSKCILNCILFMQQEVISKNLDKNNIFQEAFRIHTKGIGLTCINSQGIQKNEFITEYVGEIYEPWRWFEKQDLLKKFIKENNQQNILPDFWNIMLEIHKDDPKGYDILFIDPIIKGNFSSRLNHSCQANCGTVPVINNEGKYVIGLYAMQQISYGEELTFDYMAVTESKQEHNRALCLCGSSKCRGKYLELSTTGIKEYNQILEDISCFLHRTYILEYSCRKNVQLNAEDEQLLESESFRSNIKQGCPIWLLKWICQSLRIINQEYNIFLQELRNKNKYTNFRILKYQAQTKKDNRIQNLVITINKVKYFINKTNDPKPPLQQLNQEYILNILWLNDKQYSIKEGINEILQNIPDNETNYQYVIYSRNLINSIDKQVQIYNSFKQYSQSLLLIRFGLLTISDFLQQIQNQQITSSLLHFHAFTHIYFTNYAYKQFTSEEILIQKGDVINVELYEEKQSQNQEQGLDNFLKKLSKTYQSLFVWGQLNIWYKQSVANPGNLLSAERRGTIVYPCLQNFISIQNDKKYQCSKSIINQIQKQRNKYWEVEEFKKYNFKNNNG